MDFAVTRQENDANLLTRLEAIRTGLDLDVLDPFARAYLGLFYDIDQNVPPEQRIDLLANAELAEAIKQGTMAVLFREDLPAPATIAKSIIQEESLPIGYVILAGMGLLLDKQPEQLGQLPRQSVQSALVFHHSLSTFHHDNWYAQVLQTQPELAAETLLAMWQPMIEQQIDFLPGLRTLLQDETFLPVLKALLVPLLDVWRQCRTRELSQLLRVALQHADHGALAQLAQRVLSQAEDIALRNRVYWHTVAFVLEPDKHGQTFINFMGQEKIKLLPMLDFIVLVLQPENSRISLSAMAYAYLIRCLAQKFTPQEDIHGNLVEIFMKVMWLFYQLACFDTEQGGEALKSLQRVRVLKLYADVFDAIGEIQQQHDKPDFSVFVLQLRDEGRLRKKKNWHDIN